MYRQICKVFVFKFNLVCLCCGQLVSLVFDLILSKKNLCIRNPRIGEINLNSLCFVELTLRRSVQHGMAAKMSYAYMVPSTSEEPSHFWAQNLCGLGGAKIELE